MTEWIYVNTSKITKIAYNPELKVMYIDFLGSNTDTPYQGVTKAIFKKFRKSKNIDDHFEKHIKDKFESIQISTENKVNCGIG